MYITRLLHSKLLRVFFCHPHLLPGPSGLSSDPPQAAPGSAQLPQFCFLHPDSPLGLPPSLPSFCGMVWLPSGLLTTILHTPLPITLLSKPHVPRPAFRPSDGRPLIDQPSSHVHLLEPSQNVLLREVRAQPESPDHLSCTVPGTVIDSTPTGVQGSGCISSKRKRCHYQERADGLPEQKLAQPSRVPLEVGMRFGGGEEELHFLLCNKTNLPCIVLCTGFCHLQSKES